MMAVHLVGCWAAGMVENLAALMAVQWVVAKAGGMAGRTAASRDALLETLLVDQMVARSADSKGGRLVARWAVLWVVPTAAYLVGRWAAWGDSMAGRSGKEQAGRSACCSVDQMVD